MLLNKFVFIKPMFGKAGITLKIAQIFLLKNNLEYFYYQVRKKFPFLLLFLLGKILLTQIM